MPKRVLLVDDNQLVRKTTREMFESVGYVCSEAGNGAEAVEQASSVRPDLIVLDLVMPVMNGLEAAPLLRQKLPAIPIILFSIYADALLKKEAQRAGITAIVSKRQAAENLLKEAKTLLSN